MSAAGAPRETGGEGQHGWDAKVWEVWGSSLACGDPAYQSHPRTNWHARAQTGASRLSVRLIHSQRLLTSVSRAVACRCCEKPSAHALLRLHSPYMLGRCNSPQFSSRSSQLGHSSGPECLASTQPGHEPHHAVARLGPLLDAGPRRDPLCTLCVARDADNALLSSVILLRLHSFVAATQVTRSKSLQPAPTHPTLLH
jgi:hypothetical protein